MIGLITGNSVGIPKFNNSIDETIFEVLEHAGLKYSLITDINAQIKDISILIIANNVKFDAGALIIIKQQVQNGNLSILSIGACNGLDEILGVKQQSNIIETNTTPNLGEGYSKPITRHPVNGDNLKPLHFFQGASVLSTTAQVIAEALDNHGNETNRPTITINQFGKGFGILIAIDVLGAIKRIQQGNYVFRDGIPASDGTASVNDGILKCDDGIALDYTFDRDKATDDTQDIFLHPAAEMHKETILRSIFYICKQMNLTLPLIWYYPNNIPALGHLSHDTDGNNPELAESLLDALMQNKIKGTWAVIMPGYPQEIYYKMNWEGHEIGLHYNALPPKSWSKTEFETQLTEFRNQLPNNPMLTNKNHYTRWEGWDEFFKWLDENNFQTDSTRGPSKNGNVGFPFGACHPFRPVSAKGERYQCYELPFHTQDPWITINEKINLRLVDIALEHYGVAHFIFHPAHINKPNVASALAKIVQRGREHNMEWMLAKDIIKYEKQRRELRIELNKVNGNMTVNLYSKTKMNGAAIYFMSPKPLTTSLDNVVIKTSQVQRYGFNFTCIILNIEGNTALELK